MREGARIGSDCIIGNRVGARLIYDSLEGVSGMATVEEMIDAKVKECTDLYETLREDGGEFCDQASGLALATHDLRMQRHVAAEALARVVKYVRAKRG